MTLPTTTSDDSNPESKGTSCNHDKLRKSCDAEEKTTDVQGASSTRLTNPRRSSSPNGADEYDAEGSTHTSALQDVSSDGSTRESFGNFDLTDALDSNGGSLEIIETGSSWKEPSHLNIRITSEESADYDDRPTVISSDTRQEDKTSKSDESKNSDDGDVLKPGEQFGQFTVVRFVGGGGMGRVYEGVDVDLERKVAIKVLPRRRAQDEGVVARFLNEARSAARLNHENIAQVYLSGNVDGVPYIAFEYVDGTNLRDYVRERGVLELNEAIDFVLQAADALAHAALHGVTHRDVKPSNIIITPQKRAKLIDMGLARLLKDDANDDLTESGVTLGTFDYISPEQARDPRLADVRSDVYSLGCTFYYMLVGAPPFPEGTMLQKLLQHQGDEAPDVREANPKTPVEIASVIKKMMRKNPDERYQTPEALIADLREITELLGIRVSNSEPSEKAKNEKTTSFRWKRFLPGFLSALVLLAFVAFVHLTANNKMDLPDVEVVWNEPGTSQANSGANESGEKKETGADVQNEQRPDLASNVATPNDGAAEKATVAETSLGSGRIGDALALDDLYSAAIKTSFDVEPAPGSNDSFSFESDPGVETRRLAFCWNALKEDRSAAITLCANLASDSSANLVRSCALRTYGARDVKSPTGETQANANLFVVDGIGSAPNSFATLRAALDASASRDSESTTRVELRFNGTIAVAPMTLVGRNVEICAGEGFRPSLNFQPTETTGDVRDERFLYMTSSSALIDGVFVSFVVPKGRADSNFAIFETSDASNLTIRNSILTFKNASDDSTAHAAATSSSFFSLTNGEKVDDEKIAANDARASEDFAATVRLENVLVRGEASLANIERTGAKIEAKNCFFNLSGDFFRYGASSYDVSDKASFSLACDHIFATCGSYFVRINAENSKEFLPFFNVDVSNSILRLQSRPLSFVSSATPLPEETFWSEWNFKATSLLDTTTFCRCNLTGDGSIKDYPSPYEKSACETISLSGTAREAGRRWANVAPGSIVPSEFVSAILTPLEESTDILPATKENVKSIKELVKTLGARFPENLTKNQVL